MRVAICVITCGRPDGLERLLRSLAAMDRPAEAAVVEVFVVDNDAAGSAEATCRELDDSALPVRYAVEPRRGIPFARNTAVSNALAAGADFIAFVDDDETVDPRWLAELIAVQCRFDADVVTGPAVARLPEGTPAWLADSGVFDLLRFPTGERRPHAFTHNVLARASVFRDVRPNFDDRLLFAGGSDTHFFRRVHESGHHIVWADDAVAIEWFPRERTTTRWAMQRAFRVGITDAFVERDLDRSARAWCRLVGRAARFAVRAAMTLPTTVVRGRSAIVRTGRDLARATGLLAGLTGWRYEEYRPAA